MASHPKSPNSQRGSIILEYALISVFALVVTISLLTFLGKVLQDELEPYGEELGISLPKIPLPSFSSNP